MFSKLCKLLVFLLIFIGIFAACSTPTPPPKATSTPVPSTSTPTKTSVPTPTNTPFAPKAVLNIAVNVPLSGEQASFGSDIVNAANLAVQDSGGPLELLGYKIELLIYDDMNDLNAAVENASYLIANPNILCGVGHFNSQISLRTMEIYHKAGLPFISPSNIDPDVTSNRYMEYNRTIGREDAQGTAGARFVQQLGLTRAYVLADTSMTGILTANAFKREADRLNINIAGMSMTDTPAELYWFVEKIIQTHAEVVFINEPLDIGTDLIRQARKAGFTGVFLGTETFNNPAFVDLAGTLAIKEGNIYYTTTAAEPSSVADLEAYIQRYQTAYGFMPGLYSPYAYDATAICMKAIEVASKSEDGEIPAREEVAASIRALVDYRGISGVYNFDSKGDPLLSKYYVYKISASNPGQWKNNELVTSFDVPPPSN